jgi:hypothetical protein
MPVALAATHHDPDGRLIGQTTRMLPLLRELYAHVTTVVTPTTVEEARDVLSQGGALIYQGAADLPMGHAHLGLWRRMAVAHALQTSEHCTHIHFCDLDRVLHWAEFYPDELRKTLEALGAADFTVFGRTPRAFATHPRVQRDTEAIVNHAFALAWGQPWDVTAASRGLSRRAAGYLAAECRDNTLGSDCSWPLLLRRADSMTLAYLESEGLEFETLDRYGDEIAALGSAEAWIARMDGDVRQWAYRLDMARVEVESVAAYR